MCSIQRKVERIIEDWEKKNDNKFVVVFYDVGMCGHRFWWFVTKDLKYLKIELYEDADNRIGIDDEGTLLLTGKVDDACIARLKAEYKGSCYGISRIRDMHGLNVSDKWLSGPEGLCTLLQEYLTVTDDLEIIRKMAEMLVERIPRGDIRKIVRDIADSDNQELKSELLKGLLEVLGDEKHTGVTDYCTSFITAKAVEKLGSLTIENLLGLNKE